MYCFGFTFSNEVMHETDRESKKVPRMIKTRHFIVMSNWIDAYTKTTTQSGFISYIRQGVNYVTPVLYFFNIDLKPQIKIYLFVFGKKVNVRISVDFYKS